MQLEKWNMEHGNLTVSPSKRGGHLTLYSAYLYNIYNSSCMAQRTLHEVRRKDQLNTTYLDLFYAHTQASILHLRHGSCFMFRNFPLMHQTLTLILHDLSPWQITSDTNCMLYIRMRPEILVLREVQSCTGPQVNVICLLWQVLYLELSKQTTRRRLLAVLSFVTVANLYLPSAQKPEEKHSCCSCVRTIEVNKRA